MTNEIELAELYLSEQDQLDMRSCNIARLDQIRTYGLVTQPIDFHLLIHMGELAVVGLVAVGDR